MQIKLSLSRFVLWKVALVAKRMAIVEVVEAEVHASKFAKTFN